MPLEINWRAEAMEFSKRHNQNREVVVQLIEQAMMYGANIVVTHADIAIQKSDAEMQERRRKNFTG